LAADPHVVARAAEEGGAHEVALREGGARLEEPRPVLAAEGDLRALAAPDVEVGEDLLVLALEGERAHAGLRVEPVAEVDFLRDLAGGGGGVRLGCPARGGAARRRRGSAPRRG